ncbi:rhodopsin-like [Convolutriloba macropyga]|uniref:rhodopsin-like n=1 Tax=Convolutriloba macropyga TaxID=536237 RepID=UPI003F525217
MLSFQSKWYFKTGADTYTTSHPLSTMHTQFALVLTFFILVGFLGNFATIVLHHRSRSNKAHNILIQGLAYSDLMMILGSQIPTCVSAFWGKWAFFGSIGCMSSAGFGALSGFTSILIMSCIAYNRYKCVLHPFASLSLQYDKSRVANMLIASFSTSAVLSALPVAYNGYFAAGLDFCCVLGYTELTWLSVSTLFAMYLIGFLLPLCSICYFYFCIFRQINRANAQIGSSKNHSNKRKTELRAAMTSLTCVAVFVLCWTPYAIILFIWHLPFDLTIEFRPMTISLAAVFAKMSAACNPFIYGSLHLKKWKTLRDSLRSRNSSTRTSYRDVSGKHATKQLSIRKNPMENHHKFHKKVCRKHTDI